MPEIQNLTVLELKTLIIALSKADEKRKLKLCARIDRNIEKEMIEEDPENIKIKEIIEDEIFGIVAYNLKQNQHTVPLVSMNDITNFIPLLINKIEEDRGTAIEPKERKILEKFLKILFKNILEMIEGVKTTRNNPYDEYWLIMTTVLNLASERGISPTELLTIEDELDEITRRVFTKKEFVDLSQRKIDAILNVDNLKNIIIQPILEVVYEITDTATVDEDGRHEIRKNIEEDIMPHILEGLEIYKAQADDWLDDEVKRIYAVVQ